MWPILQKWKAYSSACWDWPINYTNAWNTVCGNELLSAEEETELLQRPSAPSRSKQLDTTLQITHIHTLAHLPLGLTNTLLNTCTQQVWRISVTDINVFWALTYSRSNALHANMLPLSHLLTTIYLMSRTWNKQDITLPTVEFSIIQYNKTGQIKSCNFFFLEKKCLESSRACWDWFQSTHRFFWITGMWVTLMMLWNL